jgi:formiminotetrahydrofolate cyclodeaminase
MLTEQRMTQFLDELSSNSPAPGGGSVAALSGALGSALTSMVCSLTIGKKKYEAVEAEMQKILEQSEILRAKFTELIDKDTDAFTKVMEATNLPKENDQRSALRSAAIQAATKEASLLPLTVMRHCIDAECADQPDNHKGCGVRRLDVERSGVASAHMREDESGNTCDGGEGVRVR